MNPHGKRVADNVTSLIKRISFWRCPKCGKEFAKPVEGHFCRRARKPVVKKRVKR